MGVRARLGSVSAQGQEQSPSLASSCVTEETKSRALVGKALLSLWGVLDLSSDCHNCILCILASHLTPRDLRFFIGRVTVGEGFSNVFSCLPFSSTLSLRGSSRS